MRKVFITTAVSALMTNAALAESARDSVDWDGHYVGTLPCASCPGIETDLTIRKGGRYILTETYLEEKDGHFYSQGEFTWNNAGNQVTLKTALLHKASDVRGSPFPGRIYPAVSVTGIPSAV